MFIKKKDVKYGDTVTFLETIKCGAPQGSILGALLFLNSVNDLQYVTRLFNPIMYADDTNLFFSHRNIEGLFEIPNSELKNSNDWGFANKLYRGDKILKRGVNHEIGG